tara:strand:- start:3962 stop:4432 length:471 start_codon:yes stop_codon:yes gene_type:complete
VNPNNHLKESYLLTERRVWWKWLCCVPIALPFTWSCCVDQIRGRVASPSELPTFNSPLSDDEMKRILPHIQTNSLEELPRDIQVLFNKIQPSVMRYAEEIKTMGGGADTEAYVLDPTVITPMGPGVIVPFSKADGVLQEEVKKMKHLFNYNDTNQQ